MLICPNCSAPNRDGSSFCRICGHSLIGASHVESPQPSQPQSASSQGRVQATPQQAAHQQSASQPQAASYEVRRPVATSPAMGANGQGQAPDTRSGQVPPANQASYAQPSPDMGNRQWGSPQGAQPKAGSVQSSGIVSQAWSEIRASQGWLGKSALLGLISLVPILNFFVSGYFLKVGKDAAVGSRAGLPQDMFGPGRFAIGFFAVVILFCWILVFSIVGLIPGIGRILELVGLVFFGPFAVLCTVRMALYRRFSEGWQFGKVWDVYKNNLGTVLAVFWIPMLICTAFIIGIYLIISLIFGIILGTSLLASGSAIGALATSAEIARFVSHNPGVLAGVFFFALIVAYFALWVGSVFSNVMYRAYGIFVNRVAFDWSLDAHNQGQDTL